MVLLKILLVGLNSKYVHTNLAIRYLKSYCGGYNIILKEYTINDQISDIIDGIYGENPDIVGFSCYIWNIDMVRKICGSVKKILPGCSILLGGPEVSYDPVLIMEGHEYIDYIIKGEAEDSFLQFLRYLEDGLLDIENVRGLVYRKDGKILENRENDLIKDLDTIPFPYTYSDGNIDNRILYYESSRGCPYNCSYCLSSTIKGVRFFSLDRIKQDLMWFINNNIELVKFVDRTFNCSRYYLDILKFLADNQKYTRFHFEISGSLLNDEVLSFLASVPEGLFQFEIGVQTTNKEALKNIRRKPDFSDLSLNILKLREKGNIHMHLDLIAGLPGEDYSSFSKSFNDVYSLRPHMLQLGFLKLLKGSGLRQEAGALGIAYNDYPPYEVLKTRELSYKELSDLRHIEAVVDRYYNSGRFQAAITYLSGIIKDPFFMFSNLAGFQRLNGYDERNVSSIGQYRLLYDFCASLESCDMSIIMECLAFDYLRQGRNPVMPDFLKPNKKGVDRQFLWSFFSSEYNMKKYLPHYYEAGVKEAIKNIHALRLSFDICSFLKSGKVSYSENILVFDYGRKDISGQSIFFAIFY